MAKPLNVMADWVDFDLLEMLFFNENYLHIPQFSGKFN